MDQKQRKKKIYRILALLCGIVFVISTIWLVSYFLGLRRAEAKLAELQSAAITESEPPSVSEEVTEEEPSISEEISEEVGPSLDDYDIPVKEIDFSVLTEENADIYAWITIPGTVIDYPVLQHPDDPNFYLKHNVDGSAGYPGCIYSERYNSKNWDDPNTVLYGHNMRNGTMFADLHLYEDPAFLEENQFVYIFSDGYTRVYQIFAAYEFSNAHLLLSFNTKDPDTYAQYFEGIFKHDGLSDNYNEDVEVTVDDKILTLETCIRNKDDRRYLVQAVLVAEGEIN